MGSCAHPLHWVICSYNKFFVDFLLMIIIFAYLHEHITEGTKFNKYFQHEWKYLFEIPNTFWVNGCREEENLVFWFSAQFNSTLNFTQLGWLILFSPDLHFRLAKRVSSQTLSLRVRWRPEQTFLWSSLLSDAF